MKKAPEIGAIRATKDAGLDTTYLLLKETPKLNQIKTQLLFNCHTDIILEGPLIEYFQYIYMHHPEASPILLSYLFLDDVIYHSASTCS